MWMKLFYFGRIFLKTATTVTMVIEITKDMKYFLVILLIAIAGYGNCYLILSRNYTGEDSFSGETYFLAFIYAYQQAMGDFDTDGFESTDRYYLYALWFLNVIMTLIVLLNLLIAIMGDTFDRVRESLDNNMYKELALIMNENENMINRKVLFKDTKYILVVNEDKAEEVEVHWDGRLQRLREYLEKSVDNQNMLLKSLQKGITSSIINRAERRVGEMEKSSGVLISAITTKAEGLEAIIKKCNSIFETKDNENKELE